MITFGVYNAGSSTSTSFHSKKGAPKFRRKVQQHVEQMAAAGATLVFMQELHRGIPVDLPAGWSQVYEDSQDSCNLRVWFKHGALEFLASTQEQVFTARDDEAHHWRMWQQVWVRHIASGRRILCANVHTIDGLEWRKNPWRRSQAHEIQEQVLAGRS